MNMDMLAMLFAGGMVFSVMVVGLIWYILIVVANWKIFQKFGEPGWKSIIPFYNGYILYKYTWNASMFFVTLIVGLASGVLSTMDMPMPLSLLGAALGIAMLVLNVMHYNKLAKAFGHGTGFTIGLLLLNNIFMLILGFGRSEYLGNSENARDYY